MMALLKALWKLRPPGEPEPPGARLLRRWREKHLLKRLERDWPGGFTLHRSGELIYVPSPLDARGRQALLHPPRVHPAVLGFLAPGGVVIDIGANLGEWTVPLARAVGQTGHILAMEPAPRSAAALEATLAANALRHAEVLCCAVGNRDATAEFAFPVVTSASIDTGTARLGPAPCGFEALRVPMRSLDSLAAERGLHRLDLIKIDVEGHERQVLEGAASILAHHRPVLVIETGHETETDRPAIRELLQGQGYRILGILLDHGMAAADWPAYGALKSPFSAGDAHNLLLVPINRASGGRPGPQRAPGPSPR
jgi:FkbM family methyltransferase